MKILIVDDSPDLLAQVCQALGRERYDLETAEDGEAALDKLFDNPFDLVLLDIMLPKQDGLAVLKEMRAADIKTPVLMLTAKATWRTASGGLIWVPMTTWPSLFPWASSWPGCGRFSDVSAITANHF